MPTRSLNPVQRIQGYVQRGEEVIIPTEPNNTVIQVQKSYPGSTVTVRSRKPDGTPELATIYDRNGNVALNPFNADNNAYYAFYAQSGRYDVEFSGEGITTPFKLEDAPVESLIYNVRDYGAKGNGVDDDTAAIQAALDAMLAAFANSTFSGVGTLFFPNGLYRVSKPNQQTNFIFDLPSGIIIQGTAGPVTGGAPSNCQIILATTETGVFRIHSQRSKIIIRDLGITTAPNMVSIKNTIAIDFYQNIPGPLSGTHNIELQNLTIWNVDRGISVEGSHFPVEPPPPAEEEVLQQWDITGVRINHCSITDCNRCIYINAKTADFWRIVDSRIGANLGGFGIYLNRVGFITLDNLVGAGATNPQTGRMSDTFIYLTSGRSIVNITGCECELYENSVQVVGPGAVGNVSWPIMILNCTFGAPVLFKTNCEVVSIANRYFRHTVRCEDFGTDVLIYSFGDMIIDQIDKVPNPNDDFELLGASRLVSRANHFRVDFQRPANFGGRGGHIPPFMEEVPVAISAFTDKGGVQLALCNASGTPLCYVRATGNLVYFGDGTTTAMRLDLATGNLTVRGQFIQDPSLW